MSCFKGQWNMSQYLKSTWHSAQTPEHKARSFDLFCWSKQSLSVLFPDLNLHSIVCMLSNIWCIHVGAQVNKLSVYTKTFFFLYIYLLFEFRYVCTKDGVFQSLRTRLPGTNKSQLPPSAWNIFVHAWSVVALVLSLIITMSLYFKHCS